MKEDVLKFEGLVDEVLPGNMYRITFMETATAVAYLGGRLKQNKIKIVVGDRVDVEFSPYDLSRGRISYRR